ncbi:GGDEF domain-containing protein [Actinomycetes bacterium M1A6_2h]
MRGSRLGDAATAMIGYLLVTSVLFLALAASFFGSGLDTNGWRLVVSGVLGIAAAGVVCFGPAPQRARTLGAVTVLAIVSLCVAFWSADDYVANTTCILAAMFLGMHVGAYWPERSGWAWASVLTVAVLLSATLSSFDTPWVMYPLIALAVVGSAETFGAFARQMRHSASHDPLTGLLNRQGLERTVESTLPMFASRGLPVSMAVLDLDNFKSINDEYGHIAGDVLLNRVASAWRSTLRRGDVLGRLGGDEFVLFMPGSRDDDARDLLEALRTSHPAEWSFGLVCMPTVRRWSEIYRAADAELYKAKRARPAKATDT